MNTAHDETLFICRNECLESIKQAANEPVTILTGIRRCGKTFLLRQIIEQLKADGVDDEHILYLDFDNFVFSAAGTQKELKNYLNEKLNTQDKFYIFLDEVQTVAGWDKTLTSFLAHDNVVVYIAASGTKFEKNSKKKSLANKSKAIQIFPLSYAEYCKLEKPVIPENAGLLKKAMSFQQAPHINFDNYVEKGGFPATIGYNDLVHKAKLADLYSAILHRDVITRYNIKSPELLEKIVKYIFEHLGEECSQGHLTEYFKSQKYNKNLSMVGNFLRYLETAFIIVRIRRLNLLTMKVQSAYSRYYAGDHALFFAISGVSDTNRRAVLENIIINELQRRGYEVCLGKIDSYSIDFTARNEHKIICIQTIMEKTDSTEAIEQKTTAFAHLDEITNDENNVRKFCIQLDSDSQIISVKEKTIWLSLPEFLINAEY